MRTLNRPMFNMGGPIKQGIMHGIREPYRYGNRVGFDNGGWAKYFQNIFQKSKPVVKQLVSSKFKKIKPIVGGINQQRWLEHLNKTIPKVKQTVSGITTSPAAKSFVQNLKDFKPPTWVTKYPMKGINKYKQMFKAQPKATAVGTALTGGALTSDPALETYKNIGPISKWVAEAALPGWAERKLLPWKKDADPITSAPLPPGGGETALGTKEAFYKKPSPVDKLLAGAGNEEFALAERNKRVQKYLDLMGYKSAKKTAIADALIDASKIVGDRGTLDLKNIGRELINPVIQATSKRLDKPGQIREAVGLMMTKADLEKEMYDAKPGTVLKNVQDMIKSGIPKEEAWAIATKGSKGVLADLQGALATGKMSEADWPAFVRATGAEHGEEVTVITAQDIKENPDKYKGFKDKDIMEIVAGSPDGIYVIAGETVRIIGGQATQIK